MSEGILDTPLNYEILAKMAAHLHDLIETTDFMISIAQ